MVSCYQAMYKLSKLNEIRIPTFQFLRLDSKILHRQQILQPMQRDYLWTKLVGFQKVNENKMYDCIPTVDKKKPHDTFERCVMATHSLFGAI